MWLKLESFTHKAAAWPLLGFRSAVTPTKLAISPMLAFLSGVYELFGCIRCYITLWIGILYISIQTDTYMKGIYIISLTIHSIVRYS